jgi:hypothetical protein
LVSSAELCIVFRKDKKKQAILEDDYSELLGSMLFLVLKNVDNISFFTH